MAEALKEKPDADFRKEKKNTESKLIKTGNLHKVEDHFLFDPFENAKI